MIRIFCVKDPLTIFVKLLSIFVLFWFFKKLFLSLLFFSNCRIQTLNLHHWKPIVGKGHHAWLTDQLLSLSGNHNHSFLKKSIQKVRWTVHTIPPGNWSQNVGIFQREVVLSLSLLSLSSKKSFLYFGAFVLIWCF